MQQNFATSDINVFKQKVLNWLKQFNTFCFLDSNDYPGTQQLLVAAGSVRCCEANGENAIQTIQDFIDEKRCWRFGHLCYELTTSEKINHPAKDDLLFFPDLFFFEPEIVLAYSNDVVKIFSDNPKSIFDAIDKQNIATTETITNGLTVEGKMDREEYITIINKLKNHIQRGDCYEINFCQEFFAKQVNIDPFLLYDKLNHISPNPFSGFYKINDKWLLCASPERFIQKKGNIINSQPIKGTLKRNAYNDATKAEQEELLNSKKDRAENVMVVDLVRNDLSRVCKEGSVNVDELFGIYSFPQVHQMISTISGVLKNETNFSDIIDATFPMGSMTGAPKINVMRLIDIYEKSKRGIFSGTLGYIDPDNNFDFNVVIRSIMYNQSTQYLSFQAGSGITIYSDAEKEWEECLVKANTIKNILEK